MEPNPNTQLAVLPPAALARAVPPELWNSLSEIYDCPDPATLGLVLDYCKARKMDPLKKPVHIVPVWSTRRKKMVDTIWPSILEIRTTAMRTGLFAGQDETTFGPMQTQDIGNAKNFQFPEWAQTTVYRMVGEQRCRFPGPRVYFLEAYGTKSKDDPMPNAMWTKRTWGQMEKCSEAAALRRAFPEETSLTADEMYGRDPDENLLNVTHTAPNPSPTADAPVAETPTVRAKMPRKLKGASAPEVKKEEPKPEDIPVTTNEVKVESEPLPPTPAENPVIAPTPANENPAPAPEPAPAEAPAQAPAPEPETPPSAPVSRKSKTVEKPAEWPKTITARIDEVVEAPVRNNPDVKSVKVARLGGGTYTLAGAEYDVSTLGRVIFDPKRSELAAFAKVSDDMLELVIEEQPSSSNPEKMNKVLIKASLANVDM